MVAIVKAIVFLSLLCIIIIYVTKPLDLGLMERKETRMEGELRKGERGKVARVSLH